MPAPAAESSVSRNALVILAVIAGGATLYWLSGILTPLALAVFLAIMIDGFARVLNHRLKALPQRAALPVAVILSILLFGGTSYFIAVNATGFATQLIEYGPKLNEVIAKLAGLVHLKVAPTTDTLLHQLDPAKYLGQLARALQSFASTALFVLVYLGFLLVSRHGFERKIVGLFPNREERQEAVTAFLRIRNGVEQYLWVQTITGLMIAVASWIAMVAVGLNDALFWAFLIFLAVYIPLVGGVFAGVAPPLFALVQFESFWPAIILFIALQLIGMIVGNVIYPRMQGRSLNIDPVAVLLALAFWGAIWGLAGAFLSTPLTVMIMIITAQFEGSRWIAVLLSADGDPLQMKTRKLDPPPDEPAPAPPRGRRRKRS